MKPKRQKTIKLNLGLLLSLFILSACIPTNTPMMKPYVGRYHAALPAVSEDSAARDIILIVSEDNSVLLETDDRNGQPIRLETGEWVTAPDGKLVITLLNRDGEPRDPLTITFEMQDDTLAAQSFDPPDMNPYVGLRLKQQ